jgi:hypothetical protein
MSVRFRGKLGTAGGREGSDAEGEAAGGTRGAVSQVRVIRIHGRYGICFCFD